MHIRFRPMVAAAAFALAPVGMFAAAAPAHAAVNASEPSAFIETLTTEGFTALKGPDKNAARAKFRQLLSQHFAVDAIGDRLIRRWRGQITPAQYQAYKAAFPTFLIGAYADRLYDYANADVKVVRAVPRGNSAAVQSQVVQPGQQPINAIWTVDKVGGAYKVSNLTVSGINLAVTQTADFDAYVQRNGFDKLVAFMKSKG